MRAFTTSFLLAAILTALCYLWVYPAYLETNDPNSTMLWGFEGSLTSGSGKTQYFLHESEDERLTVKKTAEVNHKLARHLIYEKDFQFNALYEQQRVGYPGQHTEYVACDPGLKPAIRVHTYLDYTFNYLQAYASSRFVPGICDREAVYFHFIGVMLYCEKSDTLFDIEYFLKITQSFNPVVFFEKISCRTSV